MSQDVAIQPQNPGLKRKRGDNEKSNTTQSIPSSLNSHISKDKSEEVDKICVEYVKSHGPNKLIELDRVGNSPTHIASGSNAPESLKVLLTYFPNSISCKNLNGLAPLHLAVRHNRLACFKILLANKAPVDVGNVDNISPFHLAGKYGRNEMISLMLEVNPNCMTFVDCWGQTALHYAIVQRHKHTIRLLIQLGSPHIRDTLGSTPLLTAISSACSTDILEMLLEPNKIKLELDSEMKQLTLSFVTNKLKNGKNIIHCCVESGRLENLKILEKWFFNIFPKYQNEPTPTITEDNLRDQWKCLVNEQDKMGFAPIVYIPPDSTNKQAIEEYLKQQGSQKPLQSVLAMQNEREMDEFLLCPICRLMMVSSLTLVCGHSFCRSCIHEWKTKSPSCPLCREELRFVGGYLQNSKLQKVLENLNTEVDRFPEFFSESLKARNREVRAIPFERALDNVSYFGRALGTEIVFDKNYTAVLAIDSEFPMHITFVPRKQRLCVYSPLLSKTNVGQDQFCSFLWKLLRNFRHCCGDGIGGIGWIKEKGLVIYHVNLDMIFAEGDLLRRSSIPFVEIVKLWRRIATIMTGQRRSDFIESIELEKDGHGNTQQDVKQILHGPPIVLASDFPTLIDNDFKNAIQSLSDVKNLNVKQVDEKTAEINTEFTKNNTGQKIKVEWRWLEQTNVYEFSSLIKEGFNKNQLKKNSEKMEKLFTGSAFGSRTGGGFFSVEKKSKGDNCSLYLVNRWKQTKELMDNGVDLKYVVGDVEKAAAVFVESVFDWTNLVQGIFA
eukprot:TRINITY_DN1243_c0_g1_i1.p1 TRINITY_DN1243_c0_g1~~TRINITY_DN1243_c0_g1_i1.p1  ORF type:complete len:779 (-),score=127.17 TRINITY_DN1243_c0_g1_i1:343-2679(-)